MYKVSMYMYIRLLPKVIVQELIAAIVSWVVDINFNDTLKYWDVGLDALGYSSFTANLSF